MLPENEKAVCWLKLKIENLLKVAKLAKRLAENEKKNLLLEKKEKVANLQKVAKTEQKNTKCS